MTAPIPPTSTRFRPATKADCRTIAALYSISSDGVADYIWTRLAAPGEDILEVGRRRYEREDSAFSYRNCTLACRGEEVVGMLVAFPMQVDPAAEPETDPVLAPYSRLEVDNSFYVCGVALLPPYRGQGIGTRLIRLAESQAAVRGSSRLSLIVFERNQGALRLYQRLGYREVDRTAIVAHPLIHFEGDALLMGKDLEESSPLSGDGETASAAP
ncbi:MAG: GNAT family N-acetyltransferase [Synechococcaceae cyanobacterium]|nr:GNAT family N-acetyltransferase [Synechococcaceae cyanobacterium]